MHTYLLYLSQSEYRPTYPLVNEYNNGVDVGPLLLALTTVDAIDAIH